MIEQLTPEQEAQLSIYREKWIDIGLSTGKCDFERAKGLITTMYTNAGLEPPKEWHYSTSPKATLKLCKDLYNLDDPVSGYGCHDAGWLSFYDYCKQVLGLDCCDPLLPHMELATCAGWYTPYDDFCVIEDKPSFVKFDDQNRLHCEDGPAIGYEDGFGVYALQGTRIPSWCITEFDSLTPEKIDAMENIEERRVVTELYGIDKYLTESGAEVIDRDFVDVVRGGGLPMPRALLKDKHGNQWLMGTDGSTERVYFMNVSPDAMTCKEAHEGISGLDESNCVAQS